MIELVLAVLVTGVIASLVYVWIYRREQRVWRQTLMAKEEEMNQLLIDNRVSAGRVDATTKALVEMQATLDGCRRERDTLLQENGVLKAHNQTLVENAEVQRQELQRVREEMSNEFKVLANEILQEKSKSFTEHNQTSLNEILNPLKERLDGFKKTVEETYNTEARERFSLKEQIRELVQRSETIGVEAKQLTQALRGDSKIQGDWGEMILESILEKSGLERGREYSVQETLRDESGNTIQGEGGRRMRPDVIIYYPGGEGRQMVIDSKVSLTAYINYINADTPEAGESALKAHLVSVKKHIDELAGKSYQDFVGKGDHVMMFVPNEAAYLAAMQADHELWKYAYDKKVLLLSPTNLIAALKLVADLWQRDKQTRNAVSIAEEAGKLHDKFADFVKDMEKIERLFDSAKSTHTEAMKKLKEGKGNLIDKVRKLKDMGAKTKKNLPASTEEDAED